MATKKAATSVVKKATATTIKKSVRPAVKKTPAVAIKKGVKPIIVNATPKKHSLKTGAKANARSEDGYTQNPGGVVMVPPNIADSKPVPAPKPVSTSKLRQGLSDAKEDIKQSIKEIASIMTMDFEISEIELSMSFNAQGQFLGFGVGGSASIKVKIKPTEDT